MLVRMRSLDEGETTPRTIRVPDALWGRLTDWAQRAGIGDSEALRKLLAIGLEQEPGVIIRQPMAWMRNETCAALAVVPPGSDWWDLDDLIGQLPGVVRYTRRSRNQSEVWWKIPAESVEALRSVFAGRPDRVRVYSTR